MAAGSQTTCDIQKPYLPPLMFVSLDACSRKRDASLGCIPGKQKGNIRTCVISVSGNVSSLTGRVGLRRQGGLAPARLAGRCLRVPRGHRAALSVFSPSRISVGSLFPEIKYLPKVRWLSSGELGLEGRWPDFTNRHASCRKKGGREGGWRGRCTSTAAACGPRGDVLGHVAAPPR